MTNIEFEKLKIGDYVCLKKDEPFVVKDDYVWGPPCKVCLVEPINNTSGKQCQISSDNYLYWEVVSKQ